MAEKRRLDIILEATDRITKPINRITRRLERMQAPVKRLRRSFRDLSRASGLQSLGQMLGRITALVRNLTFAATGAAVAGGLMLKRFIGAGDQVAKTAAAINISAEALQEWRFAAERMGLTQEETDKALLRFARTLGEVKLGTGALTTLLRHNAPALLAQLKAAKSTEEGLALMVETFGRISDSGVRAALAQSAFGRSGAQLTNLLRMERSEIEALFQEARNLGGVLSNEAAAGAEEAQDRLSNLGMAVKGIGFAVGTALLPEITELIGQLTDWIAAHKELISGSIVSAIQGTISAVITLSAGIAKVVDFMGGWRAVAIALAGVFAALTVGAILPLIALIGPLVAGFGLIAAKIGAVIAGVTALALGASTLIRNWTPLKTWFTDFFDTALAPVASMMQGIQGIFGSLGGGLGGPTLAAAGGSGGTSSFAGQLGIRIESEPAATVPTFESDGPIEMSVDLEAGIGRPPWIE